MSEPSPPQLPQSLYPMRTILSLASQIQPFEPTIAHWCLLFFLRDLSPLAVRRYVLQFIQTNKLADKPDVRAYLPHLLDLTEPVCSSSLHMSSFSSRASSISR